MINLRNLLLIKNDNSALAYYHSAFALIHINILTFNVLKSLKAGMTNTQVAEKYNLKVSEIQSMLQSFEKISIPQIDSKKNKKVNRTAGRITLHVANDCNLRCKYCYADGGNYKQQRGIMLQETAKRFVDFCIENFDNVGHIVFFGGEPLLNPEVMELVCTTFKNYYTEGKSSYLPEFGMITNGTILNPRILSFIKENLSFITVSIDGPKDLNDANRVFANGKGSYDKISQFIHTITSETDIRIRYEATYTQYHIEQQYTHGDIIKALTKEFGIKGDVIDELSIEKKNQANYWETFNYENLIKGDFNNLPEGFWSILRAIVKKEPKNMCGVSKDIFAVGIDGEIYPCHMNNGEKRNSIGNIHGSNIFNNPSYVSKQASVYTLKNNPKCAECWANNICGGCSMMWFYNQNTKQFEAQPNEKLCNSNKAHLEKTLIIISHIRKNPELWNMFCNKLPKTQ